VALLVQMRGTRIPPPCGEGREGVLGKLAQAATDQMWRGVRLPWQGPHFLTQGFPSRISGDRSQVRVGQRGQGMVEYALIIVLIAVGVVLALTAFGTQLQTVFNTIVNNLSTAS
jgi:pilus assembly protein Flp/PilA